MPDPHQHTSPLTPGTSEERESAQPTYRIMRRGSYYNILGPHGRIFSKYRSASAVGPRWEELTKTPWPHSSSAYESGHRLWELGAIAREDIGKTELVERPAPKAAPKRRAVTITPPEPVQRADVALPVLPLALPAPRIDLTVQDRLMAALRRDPSLIFQTPIKQALRYEVEYHRPQARWAQHLLDLLARYERRERVRQRVTVRLTHSQSVLEKHIAWQEQRLAERHARV